MEGFFILGCSIDEVIDIEELLLRRYANIDYILNMEFKEGYKFIKKVYDKELEEKAWQMWLVQYPNMTKNNFLTFNEFKEKIIPPKIDKSINKEDLIKQAEEIERKI